MSRIAFVKSELWLGGVGFNQTARNAGRSAEGGYPPHNIELVGGGDEPERLRITIAVAGFSVDDLAVTIEDNELVVQGGQADERPRDFLYRGIAARRFRRSFALASGVEVRKAELHDGLLVIELERRLKEQTVRKVPIRRNDNDVEAPSRRIGATVREAE